ncbi:MAG: hypothetical protein JF597_13440 [Streptomyces sp.]|uniref:hypothetical protein n=1 Tax=Streptomyces sp. TaxID=1931 RepID=UPI0025F913C2|nr:hypothetical protein [Streptomyces sp.]MBW8794560.1 hypothetical protein [Streptomyces sp.]
MTTVPSAVAAVLRAGPTTGTVAVVAPYEGGGPCPRAFARHDLRTVAVLPEPRLRPPAYRNATPPAGYADAVVHRGLRQTVKALRALGVSAVVASGTGGIELAERMAWQLGLRTADPASSPLRYDRGAQAARLARLGIPAPRGIRTARPAEAVDWARSHPAAGYLLAPAAAGIPVDAVECADEDGIGAAWPALWHAAARYSGSPHLVLTERPGRRRYALDTVTRPGPDGRPEHVVTGLRADVPAGPRAPDGPAGQALVDYTVRVLDALGVVCGPAAVRLAYGDDDSADRGPLLICALAAPVMTGAVGVPGLRPPPIPFSEDRPREEPLCSRHPRPGPTPPPPGGC